MSTHLVDRLIDKRGRINLRLAFKESSSELTIVNMVPNAKQSNVLFNGNYSNSLDV